MRSTKDLLERARRAAPKPGFDFDDLQRRRDRRRARQRIGTTAVALTLTAVVFGAAFLALRQRDEIIVGATGSTGAIGVTGGTAVTGTTGGTGSTGSLTELPPASQPALAAGPGDYYVHRVHLVAECVGTDERCGGGFSNELAATFWWRPDESGRIQVDVARDYGITEGTFEPGAFPNFNGIDVSDFPTDPAELADFLLAQSQPDGASPAPLVSPPPGGAPEDGRMWRAITDLLENPQVTPIVRGALLEVAAELRGSNVVLNATDLAGRPAHVIEFATNDGAWIERLYVDPTSHEFLARTWTWPDEVEPFQTWLVEMAGLAPSTQDGPTVTSIPTVD